MPDPHLRDELYRALSFRPEGRRFPAVQERKNPSPASTFRINKKGGENARSPPPGVGCYITSSQRFRSPALSGVPPASFAGRIALPLEETHRQDLPFPFSNTPHLPCQSKTLFPKCGNQNTGSSPSPTVGCPTRRFYVWALGVLL